MGTVEPQQYSIGDHLWNELDQPEQAYALQVGVSAAENANDQDFDDICDSLADTGCDITMEKVAYESDYGRDDVRTGDIFAEDYDEMDGKTLLYVPDGGKWAWEGEEAALEQYDPVNGYQNVIDLLDEDGLDMALFAGVEEDMSCRNMHALTQQLYNRYGRSVSVTEIDWAPNGEQRDTLLSVRREW